MEDKDIYRGLSEMSYRVFGEEALRKGTSSRSMITAMVSRLIDEVGPENVTELQLEGIREILDGEHDPTTHVSSL